MGVANDKIRRENVNLCSKKNMEDGDVDCWEHKKTRIRIGEKIRKRRSRNTKKQRIKQQGYTV